MTVLAIGVAPAAAEQRNVALVLDGSISMWAKMPNGKARLNVMKTGVRQFLTDVEQSGLAQASWSMRAFGYQSKSRCDDVRALKTTGAFDLDGMKVALERLKNPKGRSLVTSGFAAAVAAIGKTQSPADVVLVVDGRDRCGQDICAVARKLKIAAPNGRAHIIGLNMSDADEAAVRCVTELTDGQFFNVEKANQLAKSMSLALRPGAAPAPAVNNAAPGLVLAARLGSGMPPIASGVTWFATPEGKAEGGKADRSVLQTGLNQTMALPPGDYKVWARYRGLLGYTPVTVTSGPPVLAEVNFNGRLVRIVPPTVREGDTVRRLMMQTKILPLSEGTATSDKLLVLRDAKTVALKTGQYTLETRVGAAAVSSKFTVGGRDPLELKPLDTIGIARLGAVAVNGGPALEDVVYRVLQTDLDANSGNRLVAQTRGSTVDIVLPAGVFLIEAQAGRVLGRSRLVVRDGLVSEQNVLLPIGRIVLAAQLAGETEKLSDRVTYSVLPTGGGDHVFTAVRDGQLRLAAGTYKVQTRVGDANATGEKLLTVAAGHSQDVVIVVRAGRATFSLSDSVRKSSSNHPYWEIVDQGRQVVFTSGRSSPTAMLAYGTYEAVATIGVTRLTKTFQVTGAGPIVVQLNRGE